LALLLLKHVCGHLEQGPTWLQMCMACGFDKDGYLSALPAVGSPPGPLLLLQLLVVVVVVVMVVVVAAAAEMGKMSVPAQEPSGCRNAKD
jgi:hypothetical protein